MTSAAEDELRDRGDELIGQLAAGRADDHDLTWLDEFYRAADHGSVMVPWDRGAAHPLVAQWLAGRTGAGQRALVIGCGPGHEAELTAERGYLVTAFDISAAAIAATRARWPDSRVDYLVADLLDPPESWRASFDLVIECQTIQCMPPELHPAGLDALPDLLAPGGTMVLVAGGRPDGVEVDGPPWLLTEAEIVRASQGLSTVGRTRVPLPNPAPGRFFRWQVELHKTAG